MGDVVQWSRIFNVNKAANHLIPEENEKWLNCCGGGKIGSQVVTMHDYPLWMRKYPEDRLYYLCGFIISSVMETITLHCKDKVHE